MGSEMCIRDRHNIVQLELGYVVSDWLLAVLSVLPEYKIPLFAEVLLTSVA